MSKIQWSVIASLVIGIIVVYGSFFFILDSPRVESSEEPYLTTDEEIDLLPLSVLATPALPSNPKMRGASNLTPTPKPSSAPTKQNQIPFSFLSDYLQNQSYPTVIEATPWTSTSVNRWQYAQELGGVSLWDYFSSKFGQGYEEDWSSSRYGWLDEKGQWQSYKKERIVNDQGQAFVNYVIVDRLGTGVLDHMVFTNYSVDSKPSDKNPDLAEWGYLKRLGRLRIEIDERVAYDTPIEDWFSGNALCLPSNLARLFFWRYSDFGSNGSIIPLPFQNHIKISVYGGVEKPKWFTFTGVTLLRGTPVRPLAGCLDSTSQNALRSLAPNIIHPESYLNRLEEVQTLNLQTAVSGKEGINPPTSGNPSQLELSGRGTLSAFQFRLSKSADISAIDLKVKYGKVTGIAMPLTAFFSDEDRLIKHRSTPIGVIDDPQDSNSYLFYCNYPLPYQNGIAIELVTRSVPANVQMRYARSSETTQTQLRVLYDDFRNHPLMQPLSPDYTVSVQGNGKMVGVVLAARDQNFDAKEIPGPPPNVFQGTIVFPMGYIESNVTLRDGRGITRIYSGLEDFADGGYLFDSNQAPGAKNLPFAGVMSYSIKPATTGYLTLFRYFNDLSAFRFKNGLTLAFQHGTWKNNFSLRYGIAIFYYTEIN